MEVAYTHSKTDGRSGWKKGQADTGSDIWIKTTWAEDREMGIDRSTGGKGGAPAGVGRENKNRIHGR